MTTSDQRALPSAVDRLTRLIQLSGIGPMVSPAVTARARHRALELIDTGGSADAAIPIALLAGAADVLCEVAVDLASRPRDTRRLIDGLEASAGIPRAALGREVLRTPNLPQLSTDVAIEVQLALLLAFAEVDAVSLWTLATGGSLVPISHAGDLKPGATESGQLAAALLAGKEPASTPALR